MVETEQYFPRGGKKPKTQFNEKKKFDFLGNADRINKKRKYRAPKINLEEDEEENDHLADLSDGSEDDRSAIKSVTAEGLTLKTIQEGMVLLGRITYVYDTKLLISLPGRIVGTVVASHISTPYTDLLKSFVEGKIDDIKKPADILSVGEYVSVKVMSLSDGEAKKKINLSLMPQDINHGIHFTNVKDGMVLRGAISSIEDHGYIVDLGIPNTRCFMPKKSTEPTLTLDVGQVIWCMTKKCQISGTNSIITLTNNLETIRSSVISGNALQSYIVGNLKPGMALGFTVNKPLPDGAEGFILKGSLGYIHVSQIGSKIKIGQKVAARVLYVMPVSKLPFLTTRKIFESYRPNMDEEAHLKIGEIVENAKITKVSKKSVILKLGKKDIGVIKLNESASANAADNYSVGSEVKVRILSYNMSDYAYLCSDDEEVLQRKHFDLKDFTLGEFVDAEVESVQDKYVSVKVGSVKGRIPELHVSDVGMMNKETKAGGKVSESLIKRKFKPGQVLKARVLRVVPASSIFHLTVKPAFMDPTASILCQIEDASVGKQYRAVIFCIMKNGILVGFFGEIKAFIHVSELSHDRINDIPAAFCLGQVVNCTILSINGDKIKGSLIKEPDEVHQGDQSVSKKKSKKEKKLKQAEINGTVNNIEQPEEVTTTKKKKKQKDKERDLDECVDTDIVENNVGSPVNQNSEGVKKIKKHSAKNQVDRLIIDSEPIEEEFSKTKKKKKQDKERHVEESVITESARKSEMKRNVQNNEVIDNEPIVSNSDKVKNKQKRLASEVENDSKTSKKKKLVETKPTIVSDSSMKFSSMSNFFDLGASTIVENISKKFDDSSSDSEVEKEEVKSTKKKKKLSAAEKVEKAREEEEKLRAIEKELADSSIQPKSSDQFERMLLANPNSSELWIAYMAFHLQATEIERARAVGKKALKTISFREEEDKLNVWLALLNLENRFGTQESLTSTLQQALQMNDPFKIHSKMLGMYIDTGKMQDVSSLIDLMVSKYRSNPQTYIITGEACYKLDMVDKARSIMQKAVSRLEYKTHVPVLIKFAQMENSKGDTERAEALFEQIVGCLPQRVDIWCVYVDMLLKSRKIDSIRLVLERAVSQKLPLKKMKMLYKKWIEVEEKMGDEEQVEKVRKMALDFINKIKC